MAKIARCFGAVMLVAASFVLSARPVAAQGGARDAGTTEGGGMQGMSDGGMGGMMGGGMMSGMSCSQMMGNADVTVQNTKDGAVIKMRAKSKDQVQRVQGMARMMKNCMSGGGEQK